MIVPDIPSSTPIDEALTALGLPDTAWPGVRTLGDLLAVIARGDVEDAAVLKALGIAPKRKGEADGQAR